MKMKLLAVSSTVLVIGAFAAAACTITEGDVDSIGGFGGSDDETGGSSSTGGTNTGGSATGGEGGGGGAGPVYDCQADGETEGTPGSCEPTVDEEDPSYECQACVQELCCEEFSACNAEDPLTACRFGSTMGIPYEGEFDCIDECLHALGDDFVGDETDVDTCAAECGSAECTPSGAGPVAVALAACIVGIPSEDAGCQVECGFVE